MTGARSAPRKKPIAIAPPRKARGRGDRRSRFFRFLFMATVVVHVFVALGITELASRLGARAPWAIGAAWGALGVLLFRGRVRAGLGEGRRDPRVVRFFDVPYYVHWCACVWSLIPGTLYTLAGPFVALARTGHFGLPLGFYMWTYLSGLVVCGYGVLLRRRLFRVRRLEVPVDGLDSATFTVLLQSVSRRWPPGEEDLGTRVQGGRREGKPALHVGLLERAARW